MLRKIRTENCHSHSRPLRLGQDYHAQPALRSTSLQEPDSQRQHHDQRQESRNDGRLQERHRLRHAGGLDAADLHSSRDLPLHRRHAAALQERRVERRPRRKHDRLTRTQKVRGDLCWQQSDQRTVGRREKADISRRGAADQPLADLPGRADNRTRLDHCAQLDPIPEQTGERRQDCGDDNPPALVRDISGVRRDLADARWAHRVPQSGF